MREQGIRYRYNDIIESLAHKGIELTPELDYQAHNYAYLESHMVRSWYKDDHRMPLPQLCELMASCVPGELFALLNEPDDPIPPVEHTMSSMLEAFINLSASE